MLIPPWRGFAGAKLPQAQGTVGLVVDAEQSSSDSWPCPQTSEARMAIVEHSFSAHDAADESEVVLLHPPSCHPRRASRRWNRICTRPVLWIAPWAR